MGMEAPRIEPPLFSISNRHFPSCGRPPTINGDLVDFASYFMSEAGDQMLIMRNKQQEETLLFGGDWGWNEPKKLTPEMEFKLIPGCVNDFHLDQLVLNRSEALWIQACCIVMFGKDAAIVRPLPPPE